MPDDRFYIPGDVTIDRPKRITLATAAEISGLSRPALQRAAQRFDNGSHGLETIVRHNEHGAIRLTTRQWLDDYQQNRWQPRFPGADERRQRRWGSVEIYTLSGAYALGFYGVCQDEALAGRDDREYMVVDRNGSGNDEIVDELREAIGNLTAQILEFRCYARGPGNKPTGNVLGIVLGTFDHLDRIRVVLVRRRGL